jgi:LDH2 family malate/lactate/ureidoglycolate dehydrogenase
LKFNNIKNILPVFLICFATLLFSINAFADVLFGKDYYQTLHKYLTQSKSSITIAMYFIIINPEDKTDPVNALVNDLIDAKKTRS